MRIALISFALLSLACHRAEGAEPVSQRDEQRVQGQSKFKKLVENDSIVLPEKLRAALTAFVADDPDAAVSAVVSCIRAAYVERGADASRGIIITDKIPEDVIGTPEITAGDLAYASYLFFGRMEPFLENTRLTGGRPLPHIPLDGRDSQLDPRLTALRMYALDLVAASDALKTFEMPSKGWTDYTLWCQSIAVYAAATGSLSAKDWLIEYPFRSGSYIGFAEALKDHTVLPAYFEKVILPLEDPAGTERFKTQALQRWPAHTSLGK